MPDGENCGNNQPFAAEGSIENPKELQSTIDHLSRTVLELAGELADLRGRMKRLEESTRDADAILQSLRVDDTRIKDHLGNLQEDHDSVKTTVWSNGGDIQEMKTLWADLQMDLTALAEAISRLDDD